MLLRDTIDELDGLVAELSRLRQALCRAELAEIRPSDDDTSTSTSTSPSTSTSAGTADNALWDVEAGLRRVATRAEARAHTVRRAIELRLAEETRRDDPDGRRTA